MLIICLTSTLLNSAELMWLARIDCIDGRCFDTTRYWFISINNLKVSSININTQPYRALLKHLQKWGQRSSTVCFSSRLLHQGFLIKYSLRLKNMSGELLRCLIEEFVSLRYMHSDHGSFDVLCLNSRKGNIRETWNQTFKFIFKIASISYLFPLK